MNVSYFELFLIENQGLEGKKIGEGGGLPPNLRAGSLDFFKRLHHVFDGFFVLDVDGFWGGREGEEGRGGREGREEGVRLMEVRQRGGDG